MRLALDEDAVEAVALAVEGEGLDDLADGGVADAGAELIDEASGENESDGISELKCADDVAVLRFRPTDECWSVGARRPRTWRSR